MFVNDGAAAPDLEERLERVSRTTLVPPPPSARFAAPRPVEDGLGYWLRDEDGGGEVEIHFTSSNHLPGRVVRLSPTGLWFAPSPSERRAIGRSLDFYLKTAEVAIGPLRADVVAPLAGADGALLGLEFEPVSLEVGREIMSLLNGMLRRGKAEPVTRADEPQVREDIVEPQRIEELMVILAGSCEPGIVLGVAGAPTLTVEDVDPSGRVHWRVDAAREGGDAAIPTGSILVEVTVYNSRHRLHLAGLIVESTPDGRGARAVSPLPERVERVRYRWFRRGRVETAQRIEFKHPMWPEMPRVRRDLRDASMGGICFTTDLDADLLFPGLRLLIDVVGEAGRSAQLVGVVRVVQPGQPGDLAICGMSVTPWFPEDESAWVNLVTNWLNRTTDSAPLRGEQLWDLYTASGYFNLSGKTPEEFDDIKRSFLRVSERTSDKVRLSGQAVWLSERGVEASCSVLKGYEGTWMLHQVAKRRSAHGEGRARHVLRDVYLRAFEHAQADPDFRWAISYVEATVPWMQRSHVEFANRCGRKDLAMVLPFRLMEGKCDERSDAPRGSFTVGPATIAEKRQLLTILGQTRPAPYLESLDLTHDRFDMVEISRSWDEAWLKRERAVLVARRGPRVVAAAIVEAGEQGTNLFYLLDGVRLVSLGPGGEDAYVALLDGARSWYEVRGKKLFIYFCETARQDHARAAKLRDLGEGVFWAVAAPLLPEFLEFICELTARSPLHQPARPDEARA